ncbi:hypothetical protein HOLleu_12396 [Holothuria leucospilota]|uniref:Uncharacterized protein n=1 Tax=Holothuria leucospilota TaxID=206669 RepID=A0A9Q1CA27_HOLLE|nr:hypothetical protein HOLleu_12396 [Holothuria leucospilota]
MMDTKIFLALLSLATTLFLVVGITNVRGRQMLLLNKPFFSSNVHKSEAFKNINVIKATETITGAADSKVERETTKNVTKTFTCTSQKRDNKAKGTPIPITLHQTPITTSPKASTSHSLDDIAAVSTGVYSAISQDETEKTTTGKQGQC